MAKNVKCHSSQPRAGQYIAGIACRNTGNPGSNFKNLSIFLIFLPSPPLLSSCADYDELIRINSHLYRSVSGLSPGNNNAKHGKSATWYRSLQSFPVLFLRVLIKSGKGTYHYFASSQGASRQWWSRQRLLLMMRFCSLNLSYSSTSESRKVYWYHIASPGTKIQENGRPLVNIDKKIWLPWQNQF